MAGGAISQIRRGGVGASRPGPSSASGGVPVTSGRRGAWTERETSVIAHDLRDTSAPDRNLALELVRVTEAAALAAARWVGRGDKEWADQAAVDAMRFTSTPCRWTASW